MKDINQIITLLEQAKQLADNNSVKTDLKSCTDAISRQSAIFLASDLKQDLPDDERIADMVMAHNEGILEYQTQLSLLPSVNPQPKMGCEGCIYEKTGNNSTYPCSHCSRCYTDKYKAESEDKE